MQGMYNLPGRIVVCPPAEFPSLFVDDLYGTCAMCGVRVRFRPHAPAPRSLVCLVCFFVHADDGQVCEMTGDSFDELSALAASVPKC